MQLFGDIHHHRDRDDFSEGDHREHAEGGFREIVFIAGATLVLIGSFVASLA